MSDQHINRWIQQEMEQTLGAGLFNNSSAAAAAAAAALFMHLTGSGFSSFVC